MNHSAATRLAMFTMTDSTSNGFIGTNEISANTIAANGV